MESRKKPSVPLNTGELGAVDCELRHGIQLRIEQFIRPVPLYGLVRFLSDATSHLGKMIGTAEESDRDPRVCKDVVENQGDILAKFQLREPEGGRLTVAAWKESAANAFANAEALEDIRRRRSAYRSAIGEEPNGWIAQVLKILSKPGGEMRAFALKMEWDRKAERGPQSH